MAEAGRATARFGAILLFLGALAGCGRTFQVRVERQVEQPAEWVVAVLPLDDSGAEGAIRDYAVAGRAGARGSGALFARSISRAVAANVRFRSIDEAALRDLMLDEKLTSAELSRVDDARAAELGRELGANLVVLGRVVTFERSWFLFMPRTTVLLELRGLDLATGETIWNATLGDSSTSRSEATLFSRIGGAGLRAIAEGVGAPQ